MMSLKEIKNLTTLNINFNLKEKYSLIDLCDIDSDDDKKSQFKLQQIGIEKKSQLLYIK